VAEGVKVGLGKSPCRNETSSCYHLMPSYTHTVQQVTEYRYVTHLDSGSKTLRLCHTRVNSRSWF